MDHWNQQASRLEEALAADVPGLLRRFLSVAPADAVADLAGGAFAQLDKNMLGSIVATLAARLDANSEASKS